MTMIKRSTLILLLILACLGFLATSYYLFPTASVPNSYILNLRVKKLLVYLLVALISSFTTVSFQAVTGNRFLTPSVFGIREFLRPYAISLFSYLLALVTGSSTAVNDRIFDCHELAMCFLSVLATYDKKIIGQRY